VKEAYRIGKGILNKHALGIAQDKLSRSGFPIVGKQDSRFVVAEIFDEELAKGAF
jgi:hypothetical protein